MSHEDTVRGFITQDLGYSGQSSELTLDYDLIENDVIDSLGIMKLVSLIEDRYGVEIPDEQLVPENFITIRALTALIEPLSPS